MHRQIKSHPHPPGGPNARPSTHRHNATPIAATTENFSPPHSVILEAEAIAEKVEDTRVRQLSLGLWRVISEDSGVCAHGVSRT